MASVTIDGPALGDMQRKRELVRRITEAVAQAYGTPPQHITVLIREYGPESFAVGGRLLLDQRRGGDTAPGGDPG